MTAGTGAPGQAAAIDQAVMEWLDRRTGTARAAAESEAVCQGIDQLRHLHLDDYSYTLTPAVLAAIAAAPQPAPASASQVRRHAEQRDAPELAASVLVNGEPVPVTEGTIPPDLGTAWRLLDETRAELAEVRRQLDDFTDAVINVSNRPVLTALARDLRKRHGLDQP